MKKRGAAIVAWEIKVTTKMKTIYVRAALGLPLLLEEVVVKHPRLRLYFENARYPFLDSALSPS